MQHISFIFYGLYLHSIPFMGQLKSSENKQDHANLSKKIIRPIQNICTLTQIGFVKGKELGKKNIICL